MKPISSMGLSFWLGIGLTTWPVLLQAAIPPLLNVQGVIRDDLGDPVDGSFNLSLSLFDAQEEGNELWSEVQADVPIDLGVFSTLLGADEQNPLPIDDLAAAESLWVQVRLGADEALLPRQRLVASAYAFAARHAQAADALTCSGCLASTQLDFDPATQAELDALAGDPLAGLSCSLGYTLMATESGWQCSGDFALASDWVQLAEDLTTLQDGLADHVATPDAHHPRYTDDEARAAVGQTLGQMDCSADQSVLYDGSEWLCTVVTHGDITAVTVASAGGLSGGGTAGDLTLALQTCPDGQVLKSLAGHWACDYAVAAPSNVPRPRSVVAVDTTGDVGRHTSLTHGSDGLPIISYFDVANWDLKVVRCGNPACSAGNVISSVDTLGNIGEYNSILIGSDGLPVISYYDNTDLDLKVVKCGNSTCSAGNTITTVDSASQVGFYTSLAIGTDGLPVISYFSYSDYDLKVAKCGNAACSSGNTLTVVDSTGNVGQHTSITIGPDELPVISYADVTNADLKVAKCGNAGCSNSNTLTTVDATGNVGSYTSIAIAADGLPIVSYYDSTNSDLKVAKCGNAACSSGNTLTTVDATGDVGSYTSITVGPDTRPVISYYDTTNTALKIVRCGNAACSSGNIAVQVYNGGNVGRYTSLAIGQDGFPLISFRDDSTTAPGLWVAKCTNPYCLAYWARR